MIEAIYDNLHEWFEMYEGSMNDLIRSFPGIVAKLVNGDKLE
jgi:hypothetical protein